MNKSLYICLFFVFLLPLSACGLSGSPIEGLVLDATTRKPIPGAIVVVLWNGTHLIPFADTQGSCYHAESAVTDAEGRYRTARWSAPSKGPLFSEDYWIVTVYKAGYAQFQPPKYDGSEDSKKNIYFLQEFKGSREERLKYLEGISKGSSCNAAGGSGKSLYSLYEALYYEAKLAGAEEGDLQWYRERAAFTFLAPPIGTPMAEVRKKMEIFLKDHLK